MAGPREPIALVQAKGKKHLTKAEIAERQASEVQPCTDEIVAPSYLTAAQRKQFDKLAGQLQKIKTLSSIIVGKPLQKIKIMGETDVDALARYITAQSFYEQTVKELRSFAKEKPKQGDFDGVEEFFTVRELWYSGQGTLAKLQDRYFKQAQTAARDLGLTISSRCKLQVPVKEEAPKVNKFTHFEVIEGGEKEAASK